MDLISICESCMYASLTTKNVICFSLSLRIPLAAKRLRIPLTAKHTSVAASSFPLSISTSCCSEKQRS